MPKTIDISEYLPFLLHRVGTDFEELAEHVLKPHGLSLPMWRILAALSHSGDQRLGDLSNLISSELSNISKVVQVMERNGLVARSRSAVDGRALSLHVTKKGRALVEKLVPEHLTVEKRVLANLTPEATNQLKDLLRIIHDDTRRFLDGSRDVRPRRRRPRARG